MQVCREKSPRKHDFTTRRGHGGLSWFGCVIAMGLVLPSFSCHQRTNESVADSIVEVTDATFQDIVIESDRPVLVEFWAPWCRPCIEMAPAMENVADSFEGRAIVARIRIDQNPQTAARFDVRSPPTILILQDGQLIKRRSGKQREQELTELLSATLLESGNSAL